ncbi:MAG: M20 family metallopeptidase [Synergistaceae bacterium]|nr:M20 family metallopeptidase [Synergistaceae bacterium]
MLKKIKEEAFLLQEEIVHIRRELHQIPEVGLNTKKTAVYITNFLEDRSIPWEKNIGGSDCHSVVALIEGKYPGKCIAIRCDIDGLPLEEKTGLSFASRNGFMHACGHDAHIAITLAAAHILNSHREDIRGSVKLIFQPAEEGCFNGPGGAKRMLDKGVLEKPHVDAIIGLHVGNIWREPDIKPGDVGIKSGCIMSCMDRFTIVVKGSGGHGAMPETTIDPITISAQIINSIQTIISREVSPLVPAVISICEIKGGSAFNIIPNECHITGTIRALSNEMREYLAKRIGVVANSVAEGMRGKIEYDFNWDGPAPVVNDKEFTSYFKKIAGEVIGTEHVKELKNPSMGGDDIAFFLEKVPGTYFFLPTSDMSKGHVIGHHNPEFILDEKPLWIGTALMSGMIISWLKREANGN